jgi:hypothetical protein
MRFSLRTLIVVMLLAGPLSAYGRVKWQAYQEWRGEQEWRRIDELFNAVRGGVDDLNDKTINLSDETKVEPAEETIDSAPTSSIVPGS